MEKKQLVIVGAVVGAIIGRLCFTTFERMGLNLLTNGHMGGQEALHMLFLSSGALKIWGGALAGAVVGAVLAKR